MDWVIVSAFTGYLFYRLSISDKLEIDADIYRHYYELVSSPFMNKLECNLCECKEKMHRRKFKFNMKDFKEQGVIVTGPNIIKLYLHEPSNKNFAITFVRLPLNLDDPREYNQIAKNILKEVEINSRLSDRCNESRIDSGYDNIVQFYGCAMYGRDLLICTMPVITSLTNAYKFVHKVFGFFPEISLMKITYDILNALIICEEQEIIQFNIKPSNIFLDVHGNAKLCVFDETKIFRNNATIQVDDMLYLPPEQFSKASKEYGKSCVWSLGLTMAEAALGRMPYQEMLEERGLNHLMLRDFISNVKGDEILEKCFYKHFSNETKSFFAQFLENVVKRPHVTVLFEGLFRGGFIGRRFKGLWEETTLFESPFRRMDIFLDFEKYKHLNILLFTDDITTISYDLSHQIHLCFPDTEFSSLKATTYGNYILNFVNICPPFNILQPLSKDMKKYLKEFTTRYGSYDFHAVGFSFNLRNDINKYADKVKNFFLPMVSCIQSFPNFIFLQHYNKWGEVSDKDVDDRCNEVKKVLKDYEISFELHLSNLNSKSKENEQNISILYDKIIKCAYTLNEDQIPLAYNVLRFKSEKVERNFVMEDFEFIKMISNARNTVKQYMHKKTSKIVAIKSINVPYSYINHSRSAPFPEKIEKEVIALLSVGNHKNIIDFYGISFPDNVLLICMEYMDLSLDDLIYKFKAHFSENLLGAINVAILNALNYCKQLNYIHRNVKPQNILINWSGEIKLADFAESRILEDSRQCITSTFVGTFRYMSPERFITAMENYDVRSDVWSLGITLLECIFHRIPYVDQKGNEIYDFGALMEYIKQVDPKQLIEQCYGEYAQYYGEYVYQFLELCLKKYENRPKYQALMKTEFYLKYNGEVSEPKNVAKILEQYKIFRKI